MTLEDENKNVIRRFYEEFHNAGGSDERHPDVLNEIMDSNFVLDNPPAQGRDAFKKAVAEIYAKYPGMKVSYGPMVAEGDRVAVRWIVRNKQVSMTGMSIFILRNGKIVEGLNNFNIIEQR